MGQGASGLPGAPGGGPPGGPGGDKKDEKKKKKFEPRPPMRTGKKKKKKGPSVAVRTPQGVSAVNGVRTDYKQYCCVGGISRERERVGLLQYSSYALLASSCEVVGALPIVYGKALLICDKVLSTNRSLFLPTVHRCLCPTK